MNSFMSYVYGLLQTDGNLSESSRNRGRFTIELAIRDQDILEKLQEGLEVNSYLYERTRKTNFSESSTTLKLSIFDWEFRKQLKSYGFPIGKKDQIVEPPKETFIEVDYIRGLIDGDGSLGLTSTGIPFFGFTTKSEKMKEYICDYIFRKTGQIKKLNRNKRDDVYNICLFKEDAQTVVKDLYYKKCLCINRKLEKSKDVLSWKRPKTMLKRIKV